MSDTPVIVRRQERHGTTAQWAASLIPPALAEVCVEHNAAGVTLGVRVGDGVTLFPALPNIGAPAPLRDTLANLAAANPVAVVGRLVIATDSSPLTFAIGDGVTSWLALAKYEERTDPVRASTTGQNVTSAGTVVDRTGLVVTFTVGTVPWIVEAREPYFYSDNAQTLPILHIRDASGVSTAQSQGNVGDLTFGLYWGVMLPVVERITVPGTYTRKVSVESIAGLGTLTFGGNVAVYVASITARPER